MTSPCDRILSLSLSLKNAYAKGYTKNLVSRSQHSKCQAEVFQYPNSEAAHTSDQAMLEKSLQYIGIGGSLLCTLLPRGGCNNNSSPTSPL